MEQYQPCMIETTYDLRVITKITSKEVELVTKFNLRILHSQLCTQKYSPLQWQYRLPLQQTAKWRKSKQDYTVMERELNESSNKFPSIG